MRFQVATGRQSEVRQSQRATTSELETQTSSTDESSEAAFLVTDTESV